ncbi:hypothetical protein H8959_019241, partial [Pygathrix nigripes]
PGCVQPRGHDGQLDPDPAARSRSPGHPALLGPEPAGDLGPLAPPHAAPQLGRCCRIRACPRARRPSGPRAQRSARPAQPTPPSPRW